MPAARTNPRRRPHVLSVPAGVPFLDALAEALLDGGLVPGLKPLRGDPLALSDALIFLPTRRAAREFEAVIAARMGGAAILPRLRALGEYDEDEEAFTDLPATGLRPAIKETKRRLVLARLIQAWARGIAGAVTGDARSEAELVPTSPAEAISLAIALGQLIDGFETEGVEWSRLAELVPPEHDEIWKLTTGFLNIAAEFWPAYLDQEKVIGEAARRNAQLSATAERLAARPPSTPVIVAGSTGSNPATAELMQVVAGLPAGAVVLHGLDVRADAETWAAIAGDGEAQAWTHPQFFFHRLLDRLDVQPGEVGLIGREDRQRDRRRALVSQALLPSALTDRWQGLRIDAGTALEGVTVIEAANEREEALAIALALREALEEPEKTAALITPDRTLARRVAAELKRWGIEAEDSAGLPLADSSAGRLARLVAEAAASDLEPRALIALLRHPDARFGLAGADLARAADALEVGVLRGPSPPPGAAGLAQAIGVAQARTGSEEARHWHPAKKGLREADWERASDLVARLERALEPLCALGRNGYEAPLHDLLAAHRAALEAARGEHSADHAAIDRFFDEALVPEAVQLKARLADYPALFRTLLRGKTARGMAAHPRLKILGTLEARLLGFGRTVLGGLNEGTWPAQAENDPFLSRPMRAVLGLPPPEWRTGLSAHDFEQALGGSDVVLTRAKKQGGAPSVAARWLQRLETVAGPVEWAKVRERGASYLAFAQHLDDAEIQRSGRPEPRPPRDLRPRRLSVTEVETLIRDPYAIYARHVLRLVPLDPPGVEPGASDRGSIVHGALADFVAKEDVSADDAEERLVTLGRAAFAPIWDFPDVRALWWPRFLRIARWFVGWERARRHAIARSHTERGGKLVWTTSGGREFTLSGRADRFDEIGDAYSIIDYKTGSLPGHGEVVSGLAPQLPLEAAMLRAGAFDGPAPGGARDFTYVRLTGQVVAGEERQINLNGKSPDEVANQALADLRAMIDRFEDDTQPYRPGMHPKFRRRPDGEYDHLARFAEWGLSPEDEAVPE